MADARCDWLTVDLAQQGRQPFAVQFHLNQVCRARVMQHAPQHALLELHGRRLAVGAKHHPGHIALPYQSFCLLA
jgi:hypothetical protein